MHIAQPWRLERQLYTLNLSAFLAYRGSMLVYLLQSMVRPLIGLAVWRASLSAGADLPRDDRYITTWFVLLPVINLITSSWLAGYLAEEIRTGTLARSLIIPTPVWRRWVTSALAEKSLDAVMLLPMVAVLGIVFRDALTLPLEPARWLLFGVAVLAAAVLTFLLELLIGALAFWLEDVGSINGAKAILSTVLGGQLVPLALFPAWAEPLLVSQPFRYMFSFPLEILLGDVHGHDLVIGFGLQATWLGALAWAARTVWQRGLRGYAVFGM